MKTTMTILLALGLSAVAAPALAHSGQTTWGPWRFDWEVKDNAGIAIRSVDYLGERLIYKASLPVISVKYSGDACGPYADRINWDNLLEISDCGGRKVCQRSFSAGGHQWLELGVLAAIGKYRIYQVWYLSDDGQITPRMWSRGLHCVVDHDHHPFWRMDIDVNGAGDDQVFVHDDGGPNEGWGPGWHEYTVEVDDVKNPGANRVWFVRDNPTGHGLWIMPGPDGSPDAFAPRDAAVRRYRYAEDEPWPFGATGNLGYNNTEDVTQEDDIFWYTAHLHHEAAGGEIDWHWVGPYLRVHR
jgi:Copper amine oxidase, enzyme domain